MLKIKLCPETAGVWQLIFCIKTWFKSHTDSVCNS